MKVVIAGGSGLIGEALVPALRAAGHEVRRLVRRAAAGVDELSWDPAAGRLAPHDLEGTEVVINLAGENIAGGRWTANRRERILRSRVDATRTLVAAMAAVSRPPGIFLSASAVGYYGDCGDELVTESNEMGLGFLPGVCLAWETHASGAARRGTRTVLLRFGVVLAAEGGALAKMLPLFRAGLGGRLGDGQQWMSWISIDDAIGAILHAINDGRIMGPCNLVAPGVVTNAEFTRTLAKVLGRPAVLPVPGWALRLVLGSMADEALLGSTRAVPQRLQKANFRFRHESLEPALRAALAAAKPGKG